MNAETATTCFACKNAMSAPDGFDISQADRDKAAKSGAALPDGSFPITKCTGAGSSAENAIRVQGRAKDQAAVKAHIRKRVKALGCSGDIFKPYL